MRLKKCPECKKEMPAKAEECFYCGVSLKRKPMVCDMATLIISALFLGVFILESREHRDTTTVTTPKIQKEIRQVRKKDGTIDPRENDLDELCKDWVYFKAKIFKYHYEGDEKAATKARRNFQAVNRDLSEYRDEDVHETCKKYETKEFIERYM